MDSENPGNSWTEAFCWEETTPCIRQSSDVRWSVVKAGGRQILAILGERYERTPLEARDQEAADTLEVILLG